ncbi:BamA/TamA family outer membrane protein [Dendronalium sp. ChiSLP03b]|uniref:BamA/TamA family outer membrane protein n=1 Tax=Dendronalium sp. ChiSLP03b TaxID=3075381 RepID=UPI002AD488A3|nr:BamA/TamA family outer membrane protein [Dendronalium sp. ChiSLP03b]MDZ8205854.1 BamA/TamA family outer membrane protein [Dendronalium sp. ChiSLP03b]
MRVQIALVLTMAVLVCGENQEARADFQASTQDEASGVGSWGYAKYGDYIRPTAVEIPTVENTQTVDFSQRIIKDIQILFINDKGKSVDDKGQPIEARTQKKFIIGLLKLQSGQVFREDALQKDLQRLRRLESFDEVKGFFEEDASGVNIIYEIKERRFPSLSFGGGTSEDIGLYAKVGYEDANISGLNDRLSINLQLGGKGIEYNTQFTSPYRPGEPDRLGYSIKAFRTRDLSQTFNEDIKLANGDRVREGRFGGSVAVLGALDDWDTALGLNYTRISLRDRDYNVARVDRLGNPLSVSGTGIDDLFTVSFAISKDERDRRQNPTQGSIITLSTEQTIPIGLGNIFSNRVQGNYIQYVPVSLIGKEQSSDNPEMLAINLQLGTTIGEFPPADAFEIGGLNSVRGYGSGKVASGRNYGLASVEYRFPIRQWLGGVIFTDFASDFGSGKTVLGEPGELRGKPGSGFGYGVGVRAKSPLGLIRGDLGISDRGEVRFEVTTGQRF